MRDDGRQVREVEGDAARGSNGAADDARATGLHRQWRRALVAYGHNRLDVGLVAGPKNDAGQRRGRTLCGPANRERPPVATGVTASGFIDGGGATNGGQLFDDAGVQGGSRETRLAHSLNLVRHDGLHSGSPSIESPAVESSRRAVA